jgi:hypothetical protein
MRTGVMKEHEMLIQYRVEGRVSDVAEKYFAPVFRAED